MDQIEQTIVQAIDAHRTQIIDFARAVQSDGEAGFHETRTAARTQAFLENLGLTVIPGLAVTGLRANLSGAGTGPCVAVIGELDGILCPRHPLANRETGVSHACGHNAQLAALVGAACALCHPAVAQSLAGRVALMAVPAEEYVPAAVRTAVRAAHGVEFCSGKSELLRIGAFDDIDVALTTHVHMTPCASDLLLGNVAANGYTNKIVTIRGKAAHAAAAPHAGVNALNAAALSLSAIGFLRETFQEKDAVRIHANITQGGEAINVVPETVVVEAMIRAASLAAIEDAALKFDRAFTHCAAALGATAQIETLQGYMPVPESPANPASILAAAALDSTVCIAQVTPGALQNMASTDVGDLAMVKPVINFTHGGVCGALHSTDFTVVDEEKAYLVPAKMMALTAYHLLRNNAALALQTMARYQPVFTRESYIKAIRRNT